MDIKTPRTALKGKNSFYPTRLDKIRVRSPFTGSHLLGGAVRTLRERSCPRPTTVKWDSGFLDSKGHNTHLFMSFYPRVHAADEGRGTETVKSKACAWRSQREAQEDFPLLCTGKPNQ